MKISFFRDWSYVTGIDYWYTPHVPYSPEVKDEETGEILSPEVQEVAERGHPDCIHVCDIDFNPETQELTLIEKKWKYLVEVKEIISDNE